MADHEVLFEGIRFDVIRRFQETDRGGRRPREMVRHPGAVVMLPVLDDGRIGLIENYRIAVDETLIELPAGTREPDEDPAETARRELIEETGYRAGKIELLSEFFMSPGILTERMSLYLATDLEAGPTSLEPGEEIRQLPTPLEEALAMARDGRIRDAKTLVALMYYACFIAPNRPSPRSCF